MWVGAARTPFFVFQSAIRMLKELLKKVFPLVLLRKVQLQINTWRISTIDGFLFPEQPFAPADFVVRRDEYPFRVYPIQSAHLDTRLRRQFDHHAQIWTQDEYLLVYDQPCVIEPHYGWALTTDNHLIYPSLGFSRAPYLRKPAAKAKTLRGVRVEEYPELVSLRDTGEENYYHFYNDVLAKLFFLEEKVGLSPHVPLLVSKRLYERSYFQYFRAHPYLRDRNWIIQDEQYVRSQRTYFCKPLTHTPEYYERILGMVRPEDRAAAVTTGQRLFIVRSPKRLRHIENTAEITAICQEHGFSVVDFDEMTLPEQIKAMSGARYVVGIHGAGMTNMLFRGGQPMGLLEIFPPTDYFPFHYILMANQLGYYYDGLIGLPGTGRFSGRFLVNPTELRQRLVTLLWPWGPDSLLRP